MAIDLRKDPYFQTLPKHLQESIILSEITFETENDLKTFVENYQRP